MEQFQDFNFVISNFYTIDKTTSINSEQLNAVTLLERDLRMSAGAENPQILIYHSHSQEEFADSVPGDASTMIVGVGRVFDDSASGYIRIQRHACDRHI